METTRISEQENVGQARRWLLASRPKTLTGAAAPVLLGLALAWADGGGESFSWTAAGLCMAFALLMQVDSNLANDYFDYVNGVDDAEERLGPARACASGWIAPREMLRAMVLVTLAACAVGLPLVLFGGWEMMGVGVLCVAFCFLYSTWGARRGLGDAMVILFFGLVPVSIVYYLQLHTVTPQVLCAALAQGLVTDCLLLVNNYRDIDGDRQSGKRTLVVRIGRRATGWLYLACGLVAVALVWPLWLSAAYLPLHLMVWQKLRRTTGRALNAVLGQTALCILLFAVLTALHAVLR